MKASLAAPGSYPSLFSRVLPRVDFTLLRMLILPSVILSAVPVSFVVSFT